ncbi:MAG: hypothetical protein RIT02_2134, partial [Planctomycetota bacterium]
TARQEPRPPKGTTIILDERSMAENGTSHICSTRDVTPTTVPFFRVLPCSSVVKKASTTARQEPRPPKGTTIILDERSVAENGTSHICSTRDATPSTVQFFRVLPWHSVVKKSKHNGSAGTSPSQVRGDTTARLPTDPIANSRPIVRINQTMPNLTVLLTSRNL